MSYSITTTAGVTLARITDGTVNNTVTSLTLVGKNYAGYGLFLNENYVKLLENFANASEPAGGLLEGQLWYDSTNKLIKLRRNAVWKALTSGTSSSSAPVDNYIGDLWWDTISSQLKVWSGVEWISIGPAYTSTSGTSGALVETILDSSLISHVVVKIYISNDVIAVLSKDSEFTPQTSITGFTTIKPGVNLISAGSIAGVQFTGNASNATSLNGVSSYLRSDIAATATGLFTTSGGLNVGSDLQVRSTTGTVSLTNVTNNGDLNLWVNKGGVSTAAIGINGTTAAVTLPGSLIAQSTASVTANLSVSGYTLSQGITIVSNKILPNANNTIDIGASATRFANVYATNLIGTAITAQYADLAERFETDTPLLPGTVVELGGIKEITAVVQELSEAVFGVISTNAGFLMNGGAGTDATHPPVAVNGRVPVRVIGPVTKGDRLVSAGRGLARAADRSEMTAFNVIGRALENKTSAGEGTVEAIVKLNS